MRTTFLTRSVIAVASLAIGSVAVATPATALPVEVADRALVLAVIQQGPAEDASAEMTRLVNLTCGFDAGSGGDRFHGVTSEPFVTGTADGILVNANLHDELPDSEEYEHRTCTFAAVISTDATFTLSGNALITLTAQEPLGRVSGPQTQTETTPLSGNLVVTRPIVIVENEFAISTASLNATGNASGSVNVTTTENVKVLKPRTKAGEKAAKAKYDKRLAAAKKWYAKALDKAGNNTSKKAAVKKSYAAKKAAYKKAYEKRYFMVKSVTKTAPQTVARPFSSTVNIEARDAS